MTKGINAQLHFALAAALLAVPCLTWVGRAEAASGPEVQVRKKIAVLVTTFRTRSHADVIVPRFITGFPLDDGTVLDPQVEVVSIWVDPGQQDEVARAVSAEHGIPIYPTVTEALTLGRDKLAVDGVLFIGEHGNYERNRFGSKMYPRVRIMDEVFTVFELSGRSVPVFNDKMLSHNAVDAHWYAARAADLRVPLMAGSSLPLAVRSPELEHPIGVRIQDAVAVGSTAVDSYGFHVLEILQCMLERRAGGETGVASVRAVRGPRVYELAEQGAFSMELVDAACREMERRRPGRVQDNEPDPIVFMITYRDGTRGTALLIRGHVQGSWGYAARLEDGSVVHSEFKLDQSENRTHFSFLGLNAQRMFLTGEPNIPVERTLLTSAILDAAHRSLQQNGAPVSAPFLEVSYQPMDATAVIRGATPEAHVARLARGKSAGAPIVFEDVTKKVGIAGHVERWELAHGAAWGDVNGNGRPDLYIGAFANRPIFREPGAPDPNMLILNQPDGFVRDEQPSLEFGGQQTRTSHALFVDLTNTGKLDLLVGMLRSPVQSRLFVNDGTGRFTDKTPTGGGWPQKFDLRNATAIDLDQDGLLDLVFLDGRYEDKDQARVYALRNRGNHQFEDVTAQYGLPTDGAPGLGSAIGDVNNDGRLDLFIAYSNRLFVSRPDGTYQEHQSEVFHVPPVPELISSSMPCGAFFADLTGNGLLDLVHTVHAQPGQVRVFLNRGIDADGMPDFEDVTREAGFPRLFPPMGRPGPWSEGSRTPREGKGLTLKAAAVHVADLNHNGLRDILLGMIHVDESGQLKPVVYRNLGVKDGIPRFAGPPVDSIVGYYATAPFADYDRDGRMDIFMASWFHEIDSSLFRNVTEAANYLVVRAEGRRPNFNRMGVGATVRVYEAGRVGEANAFIGRGDVVLAQGYATGDEPMAHFGLGNRQAVDVEVTWQGQTRRLSEVAVNQYLTVPFEE
jgi:hypothetical protein